ncbi:MAG: SCO family protein [Ignavibacteriales bacterium]|nr:SCO family protein [Ignavibacteriales bacterium]
MGIKKTALVFCIFGIPFLLGISIVGYWYYTTRVEQRILLPNFGTVPEFSLTSEDNHPVSRNALLGKVSVVDFIFTQCAGACPLMSSKMSELQEVLFVDNNVQFISFSVDPETDTPGVLSEYAKQYNATKGRWLFLTGKKVDIYQITKQGFHLGLDVEGDNAIIHSQKFVLIDHQGAIRGYYDSEDDQAIKNLIRDAHILARRIAA